MEQAVKRVVIAGGGTAGWIAAAALSSQLGKLLEIILVESDQIGTIGVGEATIPTHKTFHRLLGIDEREFMRATNATFKLGISFENWGKFGDQYFHSFGQIGKSIWMGDFQHMWLHAKSQGWGGELDDYCLELQAAKLGRFSTSETPTINYAYHLDAGLYAKYLRNFSEQRGVRRIEGKIKHVNLNPENGFIKSLRLDDNLLIEGDLFIDCTGLKGVLIDEALGVGYDDWSHWLPMNRAIAVQTKSGNTPLPYTRSIAHKAGWQWMIPLQNRTGNGLVYCKDYLSDTEAHSTLMGNIQGDTITEPRVINFQTGKRKQVWAKNCISLGLSSGFLEPLESTSIHLIQIGITRLIQLFPFGGITNSLSDHYNLVTNSELESIRDFLILHYKLNTHNDSDFWRGRARSEIPDSLKHRINLYMESAIAYQNSSDLFKVDSWNQVMRGQGLESNSYHHMGQLLPDNQLKSALNNLKENINQTVARMPKHCDFLRQYQVLSEDLV